MSIIDITNISFKYDNKILFKGASMRLFKGEHMVLVGPNGSGKTTLLSLITNILSPDSGKIEVIPKIKIGYLDQFLTVDDNLLVKDYLIEVYKPLFNEEKRMNTIYENIANNKSNDIDKDLNIASNIQDMLLDSDFYKIKSLLSNIVSGLGMETEVLDYKLKMLSSGMREKVILAKLLLDDNDCLLLDEPTNFLDQAHIKWLKTFLKETDKTFIVVSHDESFLNAISNVVIAIENNKLVRYKGNYSYYLLERDVRYKSVIKAYDAQQREIKTKEMFIEKNIVRSSTSKRARSVRRKLEKLEVIEKPTKPKNVYFDFPFSSGTGKEVLTTDSLVIGYNKALLKPISLTVYSGQTIVIRGYNGIGKSTFIKTILNFIDQLDGNFNWIDTAMINYLSQEDDIDPSLSSFEHLYYEMDVDDQKEVYNLLARYGLTYDQARRPFSTLSGGQKTKVRLALMGQYKSNVLVLDEPTTHLDVIAKEALKKAIVDFPGTTILVTHEKDFYSDLDVKILDFQDI